MSTPSDDQWPRMPAGPSGSDPADPETTIGYGRSSASRSTRVVGWIFVAVGLVCLLAMGIPALALATKPLRTGWSSAEATVVAVRVEGSGEDQLYTAVVEYPTRSGPQQCELQSAFRSTFPQGLGLPVRYDRAEPSQCRYSPTDMPGWVAWMLGGMGVGFLLIFGGVGVGILRSRAARG